MLQLVLYSTDHCTLCDEALELLLSMPELVGHQLMVADISADETLLARYGERIPVLVCDARQLDAPFDAGDVRSFIKECQ